MFGFGVCFWYLYLYLSLFGHFDCGERGGEGGGDIEGDRCGGGDVEDGVGAGNGGNVNGYGDVYVDGGDGGIGDIGGDGDGGDGGGSVSKFVLGTRLPSQCS